MLRVVSKERIAMSNTLQFYQFPYNDDNYGVLVHDLETGETAAVDAGDFAAYDAALAAKGWTLTQIWMTHHHADHTDGLAALKQKTGAKVYGPKPDQNPIAGLDVHLGEGDSFDFAGRKIDVLETPGHTLDMINFHLAADKVVFTGDTLFALGCGRLFEGSPALMWESMEKLLKLPDETIVYCSHEYTKANADFALSVDPENETLIARAKEIDVLRAAGEPTVPTRMDVEKQTNPFLRPHDQAIRAHLSMAAASDSDVFTEIRKRKDNF